MIIKKINKKMFFQRIILIEFWKENFIIQVNFYNLQLIL